jgi:CheY-like chemotaxis protein
LPVDEERDQPKNLRILIVEDTPERQEWLTGLYREHAWVLVHTAARAVRLVNAYDFDLISLDYNLAGPANGDAVAEAVAASRNALTPVLVHSMNPQGAGRLAELLPHAQCVPAGSLVRTNAVARRIREALRGGVPEDWLALVSARASSPESASDLEPGAPTDGPNSAL